MDNIQSISGADAVPKGFSVSSEVVNEPANGNEEVRIQENNGEEAKGVNIDTYA